MKIICPFHNDTTPSLHIYGTWSHCHVCQAHVLTSELELPEHTKLLPKKDPTDVKAMLKHITQLPTKMIRGFNLHYDTFGYYIVWMAGNYYKRRNFGGSARYTAPSGVKPPLFTYPGNAKHLVIIEGEFNAMTLHQVIYGEYKIVSPGPASDLMRHIKYYLQFKQITVIVDHDAAGIVFGVQLKDTLLKAGKYVKLITVKEDYNDLLQRNGEEAVREQFERDIR